MKLALVLLAACSIYGQTSGPAVRVGRVDQRYCFARRGALSAEITSRVSLLLDVRLQYRNARSRDLIVPNVAREHVVVTDASGKVLAERRDPDYQYDLKAAGIPLERPQEDYFSIVPSSSDRESFLASYVIWEPFDPAWHGKEVRVRIERKPGYPEALRAELRARWEGFGELWDGDVSPIEATIKLERPQKIEPCPIPGPA